MSIEQTIARIGEIKTQIQQIQAPVPTAVAAAGGDGEVSETSRANATAFASAVSNQTPANSDGVTGSDVIEQAKKYLGIPYVFGGADENGMDCSGLVQRVFADLGIDMPRVVQGQDAMGSEVGSLAEAKPGDLIVTKDRGHILFYAGDGMVLHAPKPGDHVKLVPNYLDDSEIHTIRRIVPAEAPADTTVSGAAGGGGGTDSGAISDDLAELVKIMQSQLTSNAQLGSGLSVMSLLQGVL